MAIKLLALVMFASWGTGLALVLLRPPEPLQSRIFFFILLFGALFSTGALSAYWVSFRVFPFKSYEGDLGYALWQGFLLSGTVTGLAVFISVGSLTSAGFVLALAALGVLELLTWPEQRR